MIFFKTFSAAHCVFGRANPAFYSFDIGVHDRLAPESWYLTRKVSRIIIHPSYNDRTVANDIALMKLDVNREEICFNIFNIKKVFNFC